MAGQRQPVAAAASRSDSQRQQQQQLLRVPEGVVDARGNALSDAVPHRKADKAGEGLGDDGPLLGGAVVRQQQALASGAGGGVQLLPSNVSRPSRRPRRPGALRAPGGHHTDAPSPPPAAQPAWGRRRAGPQGAALLLRLQTHRLSCLRGGRQRRRLSGLAPGRAAAAAVAWAPPPVPSAPDRPTQVGCAPCRRGELWLARGCRLCRRPPWAPLGLVIARQSARRGTGADLSAPG